MSIGTLRRGYVVCSGGTRARLNCVQKKSSTYARRHWRQRRTLLRACTADRTRLAISSCCECYARYLRLHETMVLVDQLVFQTRSRLKCDGVVNVQSRACRLSASDRSASSISVGLSTKAACARSCGPSSLTQVAGRSRGNKYAIGLCRHLPRTAIRSGVGRVIRRGFRRSCAISCSAYRRRF